MVPVRCHSIVWRHLRLFSSSHLFISFFPSTIFIYLHSSGYSGCCCVWWLLLLLSPHLAAAASGGRCLVKFCWSVGLRMSNWREGTHKKCNLWLLLRLVAVATSGCCCVWLHLSSSVIPSLQIPLNQSGILVTVFRAVFKSLSRVSSFALAPSTVSPGMLL